MHSILLVEGNICLEREGNGEIPAVYSIINATESNLTFQGKGCLNKCRLIYEGIRSEIIFPYIVCYLVYNLG